MNRTTVIQINGLSKNYKDKQAVIDLNLAIPGDRILGLLGPNGAGKTTTIKMICGILKPSCGEILINGKKGDDIFRHHSRLIGICPQETVIWNYLTCEEQLLLVLRTYGLTGKKARKRTQDVLDRLGLLEKKKKKAKTLSGGMKRRLNLALAVIHDPEIIVLDEPEAGLDPQSRILVREFIETLATQKTVIYSTHNMDEADRICDQIAIMDHGRLLVVDSSQNLKTKLTQGNVIEVLLDNENDGITSELSARFGDTIGKMEINDGRLLIKSKDAIQQFPEIMTILLTNNINQEDVSFRWTTLEDVFIELTGRRLRD